MSAREVAFEWYRMYKIMRMHVLMLIVMLQIIHLHILQSQLIFKDHMVCGNTKECFYSNVCVYAQCIIKRIKWQHWPPSIATMTF